MLSPFSFKGQIRRYSYALSSSGVFFSQHLVVFLFFKAQGQTPNLDWWFYVMPLRSLVMLYRVSDHVLIFALAYLVIAAWALAALSFRRAANANISEWIAAPAIAPLVQIPVIVFLSFAPSRVAVAHPSIDHGPGGSDCEWAAAAQGVVAGMGLTLFAVAVGALLFGVYGFGMFVVSPFVIGATTAYFANRKRDMGAWRTAKLVVAAAALGGIALIVAALEGIVCIILASPLGLAVALVGGQFGRSVALHTRRSTKQTLSAFALLPVIFASENILSTTTTFDTYQTIEINAPPRVVWQSIVRMDTMDEPLALPFRLGVAYPLGGEVIGEGVGALRRGEFSTGVARERVAEWVPDGKLAFVVVDDVPAMRELSPYQHVHSPHVMGYFQTKYISFELVPRPDGRTEIIERTSHEMKLEPILYWLPMARWVVDQNNARVLTHVQRQAERSVVAGD